MFDHIPWEAVGIVCTIVGATYVFSRNLRKDVKEDIDGFRKEMREDIDRFEKRMEIIDSRWASLFEKFHILDKDIERFRIADRKHP